MTNESGREANSLRFESHQGVAGNDLSGILGAEGCCSMAAAGGMKAHIYAFNPREGGTFRMAFGYADTDHSVRGKTSEHADVFQGRFLEWSPTSVSWSLSNSNPMIRRSQAQ